jgi:hypothetical protein
MSMLGAFLNGFKARRSERKLERVVGRKKTFSRRSFRNEAQPRDSGPRTSVRDMACTPGMAVGLLQPFKDRCDNG